MSDRSALRLGVNVDHVATLRQARGTPYPDPVAAAQLALAHGADSITVHLREDRRHIQEGDVRTLRELPDCRLNLEVAVTDEMIDFAVSIAPDACCLVPERREELTTEGGLDVIGQCDRVGEAVKRLTDHGVTVSLFVDPDVDQVAAAAEAHAPVVELHTGAYADAAVGGAAQAELERITMAAASADRRGLAVHAGHGIHYDNVHPVARISPIVELNIGHAIVAQAVFDGMGAAVAEMKRRMLAGRLA